MSTMMPLQAASKEAPSSVSPMMNAPAETAAANEAVVIGRIKAPPVCLDTTLQKEAMSTEELQRLAFATSTTTTDAGAVADLNGGGIPTTVPGATATATGSTARVVSKCSVPGSNCSAVSAASTTGTPASGGGLLMTMEAALPPPPPARHHHAVPVSVVTVSSSNNSCCGDVSSSHYTAAALSSDELGSSGAPKPEQPQHNHATTGVSSKRPPAAVAVPLERSASEQLLNAKVSQRKTSRQGRSSQRWVSASGALMQNGGGGSSSSSPHGGGDTITTGGNTALAQQQNINNEAMIRLTTGCVPILRGGKILLVSSSRKPAWILPKGGWELDESMEESAIRECFEEAGCLGTLGPALSPIQYETRKAKKRRLEREQILQEVSRTATTTDTSTTDIPNPSASAHVELRPATETSDKTSSAGPRARTGASMTEVNPAPPEGAAVLSAESLTQISQQQQHGGGPYTDETMSVGAQSVGSTLSSSYSHCQLTLLPLYVNKIEADWPEKGRFRKAMDIDEAIDMLDSRPEFKSALLEVKERGFHLLTPEAAAAAAASKKDISTKTSPHS